jgi:deoxyadenosine/deoxycytidine kinase
MSINYKIVSIEGNIGSGKSTLLENLKKYYKTDSNVIFLREPVDDWEKIKDKEGNTMLKKFYADQEKYSFAFQIMAYISRLKILRNTIKEICEKKDETYIIVTERSLYTDRQIFAKMLYDQGKIENVCYDIYLTLFDEFTKDFPLNYLVYVNAEPKTCYERIHKRARDGEEVIPLDYLDDCHKYHEEFLEQTNIIEKKIVLDGNLDIYEDQQIMEKWLEQIHLFICF